MSTETRALILLLTGLTLIVAALIARHQLRSSAIDLEDLLLGTDGRISKAATLMFGAFLFSSWVVGYQTLNGTLSDVVFTGYLGVWVTPTLASMFKKPAASGDHTQKDST